VAREPQNGDRGRNDRYDEDFDTMACGTRHRSWPSHMRANRFARPVAIPRAEGSPDDHSKTKVGGTKGMDEALVLTPDASDDRHETHTVPNVASGIVKGFGAPALTRRRYRPVPAVRTAGQLVPRERSIFSPGGTSLPCAILEEGVSQPSPGAKATTLRRAARPRALQCSPPQFGRARACGSAMYLLARSPAPPQSPLRGDRWCGPSPL